MKYAVDADRPEFQRNAMYQKGLAFIRKGSLSEAEQAAEELKTFIENGMHKKSIQMYNHLAGLIEMEKENYTLAIDLFQEALSLVLYKSDASYIDSLASTYYESAGRTPTRGSLKSKMPGIPFVG